MDVKFLIFAILIACYFCKELRFNLIKRDSSFSADIEIAKNTTSPSEISCFLKCYNCRDCYFIQVTTITNNFICKFFSFFKLNVVNLVHEKGSKIFSAQMSKRCMLFRDCLEWFEHGFKKDGVYDVNINGKTTKVFCDMTSNEGGWTVFQRRIDGAVNFNRSWEDYKNGFGSVNGEYWLGNKFIHQLSKSVSNTLVRIEGIDFQNNHKFIIFEKFWIEDERNKYKLTTGTFKKGSQNLNPHDWKYGNGMYFTTYDRDNDMTGGNCAVIYSGGWWYKNCFGMSPNNRYSKTEIITFAQAIVWSAWTGFKKTLKTFKMSLKRST